MLAVVNGLIKYMLSDNTEYSVLSSRSNSDVVAQVAKRAKMDSAFQRHHELLPGNMQAEVDKIKLEASVSNPDSR